MANRFEVYGREYLLPEAFRMGDPILVEEVTGLTWAEFSDRMDDQEGDPAGMLGMLAVAVWQTNPRWRRDRAAKFAEALKIEDVKFVADEEDDAAPPPVNGSASDADSTSESERQADTTSDENHASTTPLGSQPTIPVSG